ncbi:MAG: ATP-binding cassette domain-containing protein [Alphaproteobacteria bacterium]|nr:ATP-binding cassette domain-containing protein [Alphaproteobacteria bacterium]
MTGPLVEVRDLRKVFPLRSGPGGARRGTGGIRAVDGVGFDIGVGETLGLVGESGCGKSTVGRMLLRLIEPTAGSIRIAGEPILELHPRRLKAFRRHAQIVFQDPFGSLDPRMTVGDSIAEPMVIHRLHDRAGRRERVGELLRMVGLAPDHRDRFPHEFSGGQRQRIGIARALATAPDFVVCDEVVSALDVSVQAQIVNLLGDLQRDLGVSYLFIAHDLSVVRHISARVAVMYLGKIVETGPTSALYRAPRHPYTRALLAAVPRPKPGAARRHAPIAGDVPSPFDPPSGCRFRTRCPIATPLCGEREPPLREIAPGQRVACHHAG